MEDPIAVPIMKLEQNNYGEPKLFNQLLRDMVSGKEGKLRIENANRLLPKKNVQPATYYYASLIGSDYSFAYSLSDTDMVNPKTFFSGANVFASAFFSR